MWGVWNVYLGEFVVDASMSIKVVKWCFNNYRYWWTSYYIVCLLSSNFERLFKLESCSKNAIITSDGTWIYAFDTETAIKWRNRKSQNCSKIRLVLFSLIGVKHKFLPTGHTVNKKVLFTYVASFAWAICRKRRDNLNSTLR